jgi:putative dimethyl sulfoxide reductase chaperone
MPEETPVIDAIIAFRYAQVYRFLAYAFLHPQHIWLEDLVDVNQALADLDLPPVSIPAAGWDLPGLQAEHRRIFGLTGSLCYETEFGLPHEFRQSQELADISGFYRAFGFKLGGSVRERPDHLSVEFEFMCLASVKLAQAAREMDEAGMDACLVGQRKFLSDHLGSWIGLFAEAVNLCSPDSAAGKPAQKASENPGGSPYKSLARFAADFVQAHASRLGVSNEPRRLAEVLPTPLGPELSCGDCPVN